MDEEYIERVQQIAGQWSERQRFVEQLWGGQPRPTDQTAHMEPLTAEDWDAARRALGPGSKSLLFGTSTRVLDSIAQRFKEPSISTVTPENQEQGVTEGTYHGYQVVETPGEPSLVERSFGARHKNLRNEPIDNPWSRLIDSVLSDAMESRSGLTAKQWERLGRSLREAADHVDGITEQSERIVPRPNPPSE